GGMAVLAVPARWEWLAAAVLGLVVVLLTLRAWRIGLALDAEGLTVRNYWRTRRFRWDDIDRFETGYRVLALRAPPALAVYPKAGKPFVAQASIRPAYRESKALV